RRRAHPRAPSRRCAAGETPPMKRFRRIAVPLVAAALALACDGVPEGFLDSAPEPAGALDGPAEASAGLHPPRVARDAVAAGDGEGGGTRIEAAQPTGGYWRYVDANGSVRFVASLGDVPAAARASARHVPGAGAAPRTASAPRPAARPQRRVRPVLEPDPQPAARRDDVEVVVYTTSWCGWCRKTLAWLDARGVDYENRDIERNRAWAVELRRKTGG